MYPADTHRDIDTDTTSTHNKRKKCIQTLWPNNVGRILFFRITLKGILIFKIQFKIQ